MNRARIVDVAVGVVVDAEGRVLIGQRVEGKPYAGWWEFPGGKFEAGEDAHAALVRELHEELGLEVEVSNPWVVREHVYDHAHVRLHFRRVTRWRNAPSSREGQAFVWRPPHAIDVAPLLPATIEPVRWLGLPGRYWLSNANELGVDVFLARLQARVRAAMSASANRVGTNRASTNRAMILVREPGMSDARVDDLLARLIATLDAAGARDSFPLLVSSRHSREAWARAGGVHLTSRDLLAARERPPLERVAASCHDAAQLHHAAGVGADFAVCGPVLPTESHPDAPGLGWAGFGKAVGLTRIPVYALGGLSVDDEARAHEAGAHGLALQRAAWR